MLKTPVSFSPPLSPYRPLHPHHLSSHQAQAITCRLQTILRSNPQVPRDGIAVAVNLAAAPAIQTSPAHIDCLGIAGDAVGKAKW
jgi:hypothetical protein